MSDFRPVQALLNQPFGVVLYLGTVAAFGLSVLESVRPTLRWYRLFRWLSPYEGRLAVAFFVGLIGGWLYKMALMTGTIPGFGS